MGTLPHTSKEARLDLRISVSQKALLEQAAGVQGKKLSEFVISASTEAAEIALADQTRIVLTEEQMANFLAKLEEPPQVVPQVQELFKRKSVFE